MASRATWLIIAGYAGALAWGAYELQRAPSLPDPVTDVEPPAMPSAPPVPEGMGDIGQFDEIVDRPPFVSSRRPPVPEEVQVAAEPVEQAPPERVVDASNLRLTAVIIHGDNKTALIQHVNGTLARVTDGSRLDNWNVKQIQDDYVLLEDDGQRATLVVHRFDEPPPPPVRRAIPPPGVMRDGLIPPIPDRRRATREPQTEQETNTANEDSPQ